jgi:hypothetical protein
MACLFARYGPVLRLRLSVRSLVVVSDPWVTTEVLHTQGIEFRSYLSNVIFDIFTPSVVDIVFTEYGDHWCHMRRIMTLPFFTVCVVQQYMTMCGRLRWTTSSPTCAVTRWHMSPVSWCDVGYNSCPTISCVA